MRVSKYLCTACVSENYSQTTESYAQAAARDAVVVGGCIAATRPMSVEAEHAVRGSTIALLNNSSHKSLNVVVSGEQYPRRRARLITESVCHTLEPRPNSSTYRNSFHTTRYSNVSRFLKPNFLIGTRIKESHHLVKSDNLTNTAR